MRKLTATILSVCLRAAGLIGCQAGASETPAASSRAASTGRQQAERESEEETKSREDSAGKPDASRSDGIVTITDHVGSQVEIPRRVNRVVVMNILPLPSIITVFLESEEKIVGVVPTSVGATRTRLLGELFPDILNASTDFISGNDINVEELMKLELDAVFYNAGSKKIGEALRSAGFAAIVVSVNRWNYDSIEIYDQWISLLGQIFPEKGDTAEQVSRYSQNIYENIQDKVFGLKDEEKKDIPFLFNYGDATMVTSGKKFSGQFWCGAVGGRGMTEGVAAENPNAVINMEQVCEWSPDIIFITNFTPVQSEDLYENAVGQDDWSPVKVVQDKNIYKLSPDIYRNYTPSTDTPMTFLWMAKQVYPYLFSNVDMTQEVKDYYGELYGADLGEEQVQRIYHPDREATAGYKRQALMHKTEMI